MNDKVLYAMVAFAWLQTAAAIASTFSKTMIKLRFASVLANAFGLIVAAIGFNPATLIRHLVILPIDLIRLREMRKLVASVKQAADTDLNVEWLKPFMHAQIFGAGDVLFEKGDRANDAYMLVEGEIELPEVGVKLTPGTLFGEMALFTQSGARTASAICRTKGRLLAISYDQFEQLFFQNPEFGFYLVRLIVNRMHANVTQLEASLGAARRIPGTSRAPVAAEEKSECV